MLVEDRGHWSGINHLNVNMNEFCLSRTKELELSLSRMVPSGAWSILIDKEWSLLQDDERNVLTQRVLRMNPNKVELHGGQFDDDFTKLIFRLLRERWSLWELKLFYAKMSATSFRHVVNYIRGSSMTSLRLDNVDIDEDGVVGVAFIIPPSLTILSLNSSLRGQKEFDMFVGAMEYSRFSNIHTMHLSYNKIENLLCLNRLLDVCPKLTCLHLYANDLSEPSCAACLFSSDVIKHMNLKRIDLFRTKIEFLDPKMKTWLSLHRRLDVGGILAFVSRRGTLHSVASVSRLFPEVDRLVGSFLIGSV